MARTEEDRRKESGLAHRIWPWIVNLWIFCMIVTFFIVRVFGSHLAQRILGGMKKH